MSKVSDAIRAREQAKIRPPRPEPPKKPRKREPVPEPPAELENVNVETLSAGDMIVDESVG